MTPTSKVAFYNWLRGVMLEVIDGCVGQVSESWMAPRGEVVGRR
jgi:hypothetical protein